MFQRIYRDYLLTDEGVLLKNTMRSEHLLYRPPFSGTPCVDAYNVWEPYKQHVKHLYFLATFKDGSKEKFTMAKEKFDMLKQTIDFGFGVQYAVPLEHWTVEKQ